MLTDTVYGLVCRANEFVSVQRLYDIKKRVGKPGTLLAASSHDFVNLGIDRRALDQAERLWPGPISVVLPCSRPDMEYLHCGEQSLAMRVPRAESFQSFLRQTGPLLSSSANITNQPVAQSLEQAYDCFGDSIDFYFELTIPSTGQASTVVTLLSDNGQVSVLREGSIAKADIEQIIHEDRRHS